MGPEPTPKAHLDTPIMGNPSLQRAGVQKSLMVSPPSNCSPWKTGLERQAVQGMGGVTHTSHTPPERPWRMHPWLAPPAASYTNHFKLP